MSKEQKIERKLPNSSPLAQDSPLFERRLLAVPSTKLMGNLIQAEGLRTDYLKKLRACIFNSPGMNLLYRTLQAGKSEGLRGNKQATKFFTHLEEVWISVGRT